MKIAFCTCVSLGLTCIEAALRAGHQLDLLITLRDDVAPNKSGRVMLDAPAAAGGIPLLKIRNINDPETIDALYEHDIDWLFIVGWSQIATEAVLKAPRQGVVGAHPTLLPAGRGRAAIPWTIIKGLERTGVTFFVMDEGVDTGAVVAQSSIPVDARETATRLYGKIERSHSELFVSVLDAIRNGTLSPEAQDESGATVWGGRTDKDGAFDSTMTVDAVDRLVRATTHPYPGAHTDIDGRRLRVWAGEPGRFRGKDSIEFSASDGVYSITDWTEERK